MLTSLPLTIPAEIRDFPEWHRGRKSYAVWILPCDENQPIQEKFNSAREYLKSYLLEPYSRQPHITLFVCGFLVEELKHNDDFTPAQLKAQMKALEQETIAPFEIEIGGLNSFASAPYLEVNDPENGIARLRDILARGGGEFRTTTYTPHLTVGLYAGAFPSREVSNQLAIFPTNLVKCKIDHISLATYKAHEIASSLMVEHDISFH